MLWGVQILQSVYFVALLDFQYEWKLIFFSHRHTHTHTHKKKQKKKNKKKTNNIWLNFSPTHIPSLFKGLPFLIPLE